MFVIADLCSDDASCGEHASCVWSAENSGKECECDDGYVLDYNICVKEGKTSMHKIGPTNFFHY